MWDQCAMTDYEGLSARIERGEIKVLSIKQPYPHHIFHDGKDVENRDWSTRGRGWIIVHAGVSKTELDKEDERDMALPRGGVVGMARIVDCVTEMKSSWFNGKYGFVLADAFPLPLIPCRGALGFFALPPETLQPLAEAVRAYALSPAHQTSTENAEGRQSNFDAKSVVPNTGSRE
jgi:hypothetical protein